MAALPHCPPIASTALRSQRRVGVARRGGTHRVIAIEPIQTGTVILHIHGIFVDEPSKYSIQVDHDLHVLVDPLNASSPDPDLHAWQYLNHSCNPSGALVGLSLVALRPIAQWEEVTFDYNTTEYQMATPFACRCGACDGGLIRGFRFLPPQTQRLMYPRLANHLRRIVDGLAAD